MLLASITIAIRLNFWKPIIDVAGGLSPLPTRMPVPKSPVDEHDGFIFWKYEVRRSGKSFVVDEIAKPEFMQQAAERKLRCGARTLYALHESGAAIRRQAIHQDYIRSINGSVAA